MVSKASEDLPEPGQAGHDDQAVAGEVEIDILEIVLAGPANGDGFQFSHVAADLPWSVRHVLQNAHGSLNCL
jgi:hypothetical protein